MINTVANSNQVGSLVRLRIKLNQIIEEVNSLEGGGGGSGGVVGSGSPEGVQTANPGTSYLDDLTDDFWFKKTGTGNTGWLQLQ